jgi:type III pantothenate kinase
MDALVEDSGSRLELTIDRGNSTLDCMLTGPEFRTRQRFEPSLDGFVEFLHGRRPDVAACLSVVPGALDGIEAWLVGSGVRALRVGRDLHCPLQIEYDDPTSLGMDRWVGALAALRAFGDAIVVDCGTALTVNVVRRDGRFLGGAIAPGATTMARGLAMRAPALPACDFGASVRLPAKSSGSAVASGVVLGYAGMADRLTTACREASGLASPALVATGGEAELLVRHSEHRFRLEPDLVHRGLRCLLREQA